MKMWIHLLGKQEYVSNIYYFFQNMAIDSMQKSTPVELAFGGQEWE